MMNVEKMVDEALEVIAKSIGKENINPINRPITINTRAIISNVV